MYGLPCGPTSMPPPLAAELLTALLAQLIDKSFVVTALELMVVVLPSTCKLPSIVAGPVMYKLPPVIPDEVMLPVVLIELLPNADKNEATFESPYWAGNPVD